MLWPIHLISSFNLKNYPECIPNWTTDQLRCIEIKINTMLRKSLKATKLLFRHLILGTCSDYEVIRLGIYIDYNSGFDFRLRNLNRLIQYNIFEDLHKNIGNKNPPTLFFDILYFTTIIYEDSSLGFRLSGQE